MVDLTTCTEIANEFGGSEKKKTLIYKDKRYMVKFPDPIREKNNDLSYMNNQFSEYIGCEIFKSLSINTQNTFLGKYTERTGKYPSGIFPDRPERDPESDGKSL